MMAFIKDLLREISNNPGRFISLVIITALGAASVIGIQATAIDMRNIADKTYKENSLYDLQIKSSFGFKDKDVQALVSTKNVEKVMPTYIIDVFLNIDNEHLAVRTYSLPADINKIEIIEGRLPQKANECLVERSLLKENNIKLNDSITLSLDNMEDYFALLAEDNLTVVGVVSSPLYITFQRGNTMLGDGSLSYYIYLPQEAYVLDVFTDIYLVMEGSTTMDNLTEDYYDIADKWKKDIDVVASIAVKEKQDELLNGQKEIDEGWQEYYDGVTKLNKESAKGWSKLDDALVKLNSAKKDLEKGQILLDDKIKQGLSDINNQLALLDQAQSDLNENYAMLTTNQQAINDGRQYLEDLLTNLQAIGPPGTSPELDEQYTFVYSSLAQLDNDQADLDVAKAQLDAIQLTLNDSYALLENASIMLETERKKAQEEIDKGWIAYNKGYKQYKKGIADLVNETKKADKKLSDAKNDLLDAQEKLDDAPQPEWFIFTRKDGIAFDSYYQDTMRLQKIGYVFPLVFFLVAVMVSLTSMSRLVENQRTQIGTYKALGYYPVTVIIKYLFYAFSASFLGGVIGVLVGNRLFPLIITDAYGHLYNMPPVETPIPIAIALFAIGSAVIAVVFITFTTYINSMSGNPALLMRPKSPAIGKKVFLERFTYIWDRLSFFSKVTARNVFRYKKRFIMTLFGIMGCSAILLTAFGLRDSIGAVADLQYDNIIKYDVRVYLKDITKDQQKEQLINILVGDYLFIREESVTITGANRGFSVSMIIPEKTESIGEFVDLSSPYTKEKVSMSRNSILLTEKLAREIEVAVGDSFNIVLSDGRTYTTKVTGIVDNYVTHFLYLSSDMYFEIFGEEVYNNGLMINNQNVRDFANLLLENENVRVLLYKEELKSYVSDSTDAMSVVTVVLIVLACALALIVLFNLTNINIAERTRELATMKVLGLYDNELSTYIYSENVVVTILGIMLGLIGGILLHRFVLTSVEIDVLKFPKIIYFHSYVYAISLSVVFAIFVNFVMNYKLKAINMVESLKSVE